MEEGEGEGLERVDIIDDVEIKKKGPVPQAPPLPGSTILPPGVTPATPVINLIEASPAEGDQAVEEPSPKEEPAQVVVKKAYGIIDAKEDKKLRSEWTSMFLEGHGFEYILKVFMDKDIGTGEHSQFELKHIAFLLKLLRIFIMAAFSTSDESNVYTAVNLVRRTSSMQEDIAESPSPSDEGSRFLQLQRLMAGPLGEEIISHIDYKALMHKILNIISQIFIKKGMIFEDKLIIENALSLLVGCILHKTELLADLYSFKTDIISSCDEFVLHGLLFCQEEKIREEFKQSFSCLAQKLVYGTGDNQAPLFYLLKLLSNRFAMISEYPCK